MLRQTQQTQIVGTELEKIAQILNFEYNIFMYLKIFIDSSDKKLHEKYREAVEKHHKKIMENPEMIDAGFDLFTPGQSEDEEEEEDEKEEIVLLNSVNNKNKPYTLDFKVICSAKMVTDIDVTCEDEILYNTGYDMRPRSSISNTPLRLANSIGTIDAGYRGHLMGKFDLYPPLYKSVEDTTEIGCIIDKYTRLVQICAPGLLPILVKIVDSKEELGTTVRGAGGFGSTGKT
jgi:dUTPase